MLSHYLEKNVYSHKLYTNKYLLFHCIQKLYIFVNIQFSHILMQNNSSEKNTYFVIFLKIKIRK